MVHVGEDSRLTTSRPFVYVGEYEARPKHVEELAEPLRRLHPRDWPQVEQWPIWFWTNNPYLVDCFEADQVYVCRVVNYEPVYKPLSEHPDWFRLSNQSKAGELWSLVGEDWVKE